ncbi:unknown [Clostridium sp. CAG:149]|nr:unknown [Clostridium sp. CAG:149]
MGKKRCKEVDKYYDTLKKIAEGKKFIISQDREMKFDSQHEKYMEAISVLHFFKDHELDDIENRVERSIESAKRLSQFKGIITIFVTSIGMIISTSTLFLSEILSIKTENWKADGKSESDILDLWYANYGNIIKIIIIYITVAILLYLVISLHTSKQIDRGTFLLNVIKKYKEMRNSEHSNKG